MTLKELRSAKHLTTKMAASLCGISYQHYNFIECGKRRPSVEVAKKIAEAFGFDWTRFYEEE